MATAEDITHRFNFHPATTPERANAHHIVREACKYAAHQLNELVPEGREKALAFTKLEEAMMWANAGIARQPD